VPRNRKRRLWLQVHADRAQGTKEQFIQVLLRSIERGDYRLPEGWQVTIRWKNRESNPYREGPWTQEMSASRQSSKGFDQAVSAWLRRQL
jgi:hypothetical protein